jgi:hypothetical protein
MSNPSRWRAVDWVDSLRPADSGMEASRMGEPQRNRIGGDADAQDLPDRSGTLRTMPLRHFTKDE